MLLVQRAVGRCKTVQGKRGSRPGVVLPKAFAGKWGRKPTVTAAGHRNVSAECILTDEEEWYRERNFDPFVSYSLSADGRRKVFLFSFGAGLSEIPESILKGSKTR